MDLREAYARLDPVSPLDAGSDLYVHRPSDVVGRLASELKLASSPKHILLAGQRGSGKSTELIRLENEISDELIPFRFSIQDYVTDVHSRFSSSDLYDAIVSAGKELWTTRFNEKFPTNYEDTSKFRLQERYSWEVFLNSLSKTSTDLNGSICFLIDDFDRVPLKLAVRVLDEALPDLVRLPCHIVLVTHLSIAYSGIPTRAKELITRLATLPNVVVRTREGQNDPEGVKTMKEILTRRLTEEVIDESISFLAAVNSGGVLGEMMWLVQTACANAAFRKGQTITVDDFNDAKEERRRTYLRDLDGTDLSFLEKAARTGEAKNAERRRHLLFTGALLEYENSKVWWDCHPILRPLFEDKRPR